MSKVHIYTEKFQPATRYNIGAPIGRNIWITNGPRKPMFADCCRRSRWAKYLHVQVYYDGTRVWCRPGHGCNK